MTRIPTLLVCLLLPVFACLSAMAANAAPRALDLESLLRNGSADATPEEKKLREIWSSALQLKREDERYAEQLAELRRFMDEYAQTRKGLEAEKAAPVPDVSPSVGRLDAEGIDQALAQARNNRLELERQRDELVDAVGRIDEPGDQNLLGTLQTQLQQARKAVDKLQQNATPTELHRAEELLASVRQQSLERHIQLIEQRLLSASQRQRIAGLRLTLVERQLEGDKRRIEALEARQIELRRASAEATIADSDRVSGTMADVPALAAQGRRNQELAATLARYSQDMERLQQERRRVEQGNGELAGLRNDLNEQLQWLQINRSFGETMRQRLLALPAPLALAPLEAGAVHARVDRYEFQSELGALQRNESSQGVLTHDEFEALDRAQRESLQKLLRSRVRLLEQLLGAIDSSIREQVSLAGAYALHNKHLADIRELTNEKLFWMPDVRPVDRSFVTSMRETAGWLAAPATWQPLARSIRSSGTARLSLHALAATVLIVLGFVARNGLVRYLSHVAPAIGKVTRDMGRYSFVALLLGVLVALLPAALVWLFGNALQVEADGTLVGALNRAAQQLGVPLFIWVLVGGLSHQDGLLVHHFNLGVEKVRSAWCEFRSAMLLLLPALFLFDASANLYEPAVHATLGRVSFIWIAIVLSRFAWRLYRRSVPLIITDSNGSGLSWTNHLLWGMLIGAPWLAIAGALMGYLATAGTLLWQLETSLLLGFGFLLVYFLVRRWMLIQRRRLAFDRARARRAQTMQQRERQQERESNPAEQAEALPNPEEVATTLNELDLDTISAQSMGLLRTVLMLGFMFSLIPLWSETRTAFGFLDSVHVWQITSGSGDNVATDVISLKDLVLAAFVVFLTTVVVRNLPGLMELGLLQYLRLARGTGFAITTVTKYVVIVVGVVASLNLVGIDWARAQWLVAALTVGLGFGLQEIFANFVSGLIILFEKPIRLNDVITIRDLTGTVTQIKTRATTILDWDRREIIVPNKAFITEQLINWSLTDTIIRVKLKIRVQLDADTQLVRQLIEAAMTDCDGVLGDPAPSVFLMEITDSALIYEVRVFVSEMSERLPMTDALHSLLLARLRRHGIDMPHQKIDIDMVGASAAMA